MSGVLRLAVQIPGSGDALNRLHTVFHTLTVALHMGSGGISKMLHAFWSLNMRHKLYVRKTMAVQS